MTIEEMLEQHEVYKLKGIQLSDNDLFDWICLQDAMLKESNNIKCEYAQKKLELDKDKGLRMIELKLETDEKGKGLYTDKTAEGRIRDEFYERELDLITKKTVGDNLYNSAGVINDLVNIVKLHRKQDFTL